MNNGYRGRKRNPSNSTENNFNKDHPRKYPICMYIYTHRENKSIKVQETQQTSRRKDQKRNSPTTHNNQNTKCTE